jgi:hypothetical protein
MEGEALNRLISWINAGGGNIEPHEVDPDETARMADEASRRLLSGWSGSFEDVPGDLVWDLERVFFEDTLLALGAVAVLRDGWHVLRFSPRPLEGVETLDAIRFICGKFMLEAVEDCGRGLALSPSRRCPSVRAGITKALMRERTWLGGDGEKSGLGRGFSWWRGIFRRRR